MIPCPNGFANRVPQSSHARPTGSRWCGCGAIALVRLRGNRAVRYETFIEGWLRGGQPWGRPVDLLVMPDDALLISDDHAGAVYRIAWAP